MNSKKMIAVDTKVLIALLLQRSQLIGVESIYKITNSVLLLPAIVKLELDYLHEIGKIKLSGEIVLQSILTDLIVITIYSILKTISGWMWSFLHVECSIL